MTGFSAKSAICLGRSCGPRAKTIYSFCELFGISSLVPADRILGFLDSEFGDAARSPSERLACAVRDCMAGWGTDDTGLITLLVHLSERHRRDLVDKYRFGTGHETSIPNSCKEIFMSVSWPLAREIKNGGDIYEAIEGDTSGDYKHALLALVKPPPKVSGPRVQV